MPMIKCPLCHQIQRCAVSQGCGLPVNLWKKIREVMESRPEFAKQAEAIRTLFEGQLIGRKNAAEIRRTLFVRMQEFDPDKLPMHDSHGRKIDQAKILKMRGK